jgi:hypothetical protein
MTFTESGTTQREASGAVGVFGVFVFFFGVFVFFGVFSSEAPQATGRRGR